MASADLRRQGRQRDAISQTSRVACDHGRLLVLRGVRCSWCVDNMYAQLAGVAEVRGIVWADRIAYVRLGHAELDPRRRRRRRVRWS